MPQDEIKHSHKKYAYNANSLDYVSADTAEKYKGGGYGDPQAGLVIKTWAQQTPEGYSAGTKMNLTTIVSHEEILAGNVSRDELRQRIDKFYHEHAIDGGLFKPQLTYLDTGNKRYQPFLDRMADWGMQNISSVQYAAAHKDQNRTAADFSVSNPGDPAPAVQSLSQATGHSATQDEEHPRKLSRNEVKQVQRELNDVIHSNLLVDGFATRKDGRESDTMKAIHVFESEFGSATKGGKLDAKTLDAVHKAFTESRSDIRVAEAQPQDRPLPTGKGQPRVQRLNP